jgi:hypothetical protein
MTLSNRLDWEGEEWEKYIQLLLKRHYGPDNYQEISAKHVGDFGIEGYSTNGCAYQCYATQEPCATKQRYEAQRKKITADIGKFINNRLELVKIFGNTIIRRWILIVPFSESALLVQHASTKSEEVLQANLPYVSDEFKIIINTDSCFAKEINDLANVDFLDIKIENLEINVEKREDWLDNNDRLVSALNSKAEKIPKFSSNGEIEKFKYSIIDHYLRGQNLLNTFSMDFPDIYAKLNTCKRTYEYGLETISTFNDNLPSQYLKEALEKYSCELQKSVPNLPPATIQAITWEAISDWLMRCPLDF